MPIAAGDTFHVADRDDQRLDWHLWIIISDPFLDAENVIMVSLTEYDSSKEDTCILEVGEHEYIRKRSCVAYEYARRTTLQNLERLMGSAIYKHLPCNSGLLRKIRAGASLSRRIKLDILRLLLEQGVLD